jgi:APA family basic amino acid/polyamine antiporter
MATTETTGGVGRGPAATPARSTPAAEPARLGLAGATALVVGSIVGVGIFNLPTSLAGYGPITLVSMGLTTVGAVALALVLAALSRRVPEAGGPYAYARLAFGNRLGFANAWSYWIAAWAGNAAIAVGWVLYVEVFVNKALVNLSGIRNTGAFQLATTTLKFGALAFMSVVGLFYIDTANFTPLNVSGGSAVDAIGGGMSIALFSYIGLETASVAAAKVRDPGRNVPRATMLGTLASAVVYILALTAIFGIVPTTQLAGESAPFSAAADTMFGGALWGNVMAAVVIVSGIGALNGWTMVTAEMPRAAAQDGLFPERFRNLNGRGAPAYGILASTALASAAVLIDYLGSDGETVFTTLILMTGITSAIPYGFSALAQIKWRLADRKQLETARFVRDMTVAIVALVFSLLFIWYSRNTGHGFWIYWGPFLMTAGAFLLGVPVYRAQRRRMSPVTEEEEMEDTVVVLRFNDLGQARHALDELKRLDRDRTLRVSAAALVERPGEGSSGTPTGTDDAEGFYVPKRGIVGILVDAISGPAEALYGEPTETFRGHGDRVAHEAERELVVDEIRRALEPGVTLVIAEIADPDPRVLDSTLEALGGTVTRRAARDVYAEVSADRP